MEKNPSIYDKTQACESESESNQKEKLQIFSQNSFNQIEETKNLQQKQFNNNLDNFCYQFSRDYFEKVNETLTIKQLSKKYSIKNRRVYDLLGILEGFQFVHKLKVKGTYLWIGTQTPAHSFNFEQNKSVSLKDISGLLRLILVNCKQGLSIKQLNQKIKLRIQQKTKIIQSALTINRRIYECLKVMKTFGMVQKVQNLYKICTGKLKNSINRENLPEFVHQNITKSQKKVLQRVLQKIGNQKLQNYLNTLISQKS